MPSPRTRTRTFGILASACGALCVTILFAEPSRAGTIRDDVADSQYTNLAGQSAYNSVGLVNYSTGSGSFTASATLISDRWLLTAAHVTADSSTSNMYVTIGGVTYSASIIVANTGWTSDPSPGTNGYDMGLILLGQSVTN